MNNACFFNIRYRTSIRRLILTICEMDLVYGDIMVCFVGKKRPVHTGLVKRDLFTDMFAFGFYRFCELRSEERRVGKECL